MAISNQNVLHITDALRNIFKKEAKVENQASDGSAESVAVNVSSIDKDQLNQLNALAQQVPDKFASHRSGTGQRIAFF